MGTEILEKIMSKQHFWKTTFSKKLHDLQNNVSQIIKQKIQ